MDPTIPLAPVRAFAEPPFVDDAAELLAAAPLSAIGFGFTSSAYVIGAEGEALMVARLQERTGEIPVTATCAAAVRGLRALSVDRLMLISPPWFDDELDSLGTAYFHDQGFEVVRSGPVDLPSDQRQIEPADLYDWVRVRVPETADAVFIGGNGFRSVGTIHALEADLDRPVLSANQALFWDLLRSRPRRPPSTATGSSSRTYRPRTDVPQGERMELAGLEPATSRVRCGAPL